MIKSRAACDLDLHSRGLMASSDNPDPTSLDSFRVEGDEVLHRWFSFSLIRRRVRLGSVVFERSFVESPGAVGVVAIDASERMVLVEQYRPSLKSTLIEIPAGMRDVPGEDPLITAQRELKEETGITAAEWSYLGSCVGAAAVTNSRVEIFRASGLVEGEREPHGPEEDAMIIRRLSVAEALALIDSGDIVDAKTVIGIFLHARGTGI